MNAEFPNFRSINHNPNKWRDSTLKVSDAMSKRILPYLDQGGGVVHVNTTKHIKTDHIRLLLNLLGVTDAELCVHPDAKNYVEPEFSCAARASEHKARALKGAATHIDDGLTAAGADSTFWIQRTDGSWWDLHHQLKRKFGYQIPQIEIARTYRYYRDLFSGPSRAAWHLGATIHNGRPYTVSAWSVVDLDPIPKELLWEQLDASICTGRMPCLPPRIDMVDTVIRSGKVTRLGVYPERVLLNNEPLRPWQFNNPSFDDLNMLLGHDVIGTTPVAPILLARN